MIGYGAEDRHFVLELTYNYGIGSYQLGNDFQVICLSALFLMVTAWQLVECSGGNVCLDS